ncbi:MAG: hypothetical protein KJO17_02130, partial [Acidimicrobiia bacterium]|nr:hypothetical protein [Acidimicrobiia bacterium]
MPFRRSRDVGVALRPQPAPGDRRVAEPVTTAGEQPAPVPPPSEPPRRRWPVALASLAALLMLGGAVAFTWWQTRDDPSVETVEPPAVVGDTKSVLFVVEGVDGRATSLALFVSDGVENHRVLVAPPDLTMQVPGYGDGNLREAQAIEDAALVRLALINELGLRIDETITLGPGEIEAVLGEAVRVDLPNAFIVNT